jgi:hypothetical protein
MKPCLLAGAAFAALAFVSAAHADKPSPAKSVATLSVTFEVAGAGSFNKKDKTGSGEWTVKDTYTISQTMLAQPPSGYGSLHKMEAAQQATETNRSAAANRAATNMAPMMQQAEAIAKKCGDDEACMQRETMKMAQGIDPNSAAMKSAKSDIQTASKPPADRYQVFSGGSQTGEFKVEEEFKFNDRDPLCLSKPKQTCHTTTTVAGAGPILLNGKPKFDSTAIGEIDLAGGTLKLQLQPPFPVAVKQTIVSDKPGLKTGTTDAMRFMTDLKLDLLVTANCTTGCKGEKTFDIKDQLDSQPAKLKVSWSFSRK